MEKIHYDGPVILVIMDGVGLNSKTKGNALAHARIPFLRRAIENYPSLALSASGESVGLSAGQMGNSEVGHNTIGSGQITKQGLARIDSAFDSGEIWQSKSWQGAIKNVLKNNSTLHFAGILSDGGVHSHISHLEKMIAKAVKDGVKNIRIHAIFDGRDVAPQSAGKYLKRLDDFIKKYHEVDIRIASGGGRMVIVTDRYEADWSMVKRGWRTIVEGKSTNSFPSAQSAILQLRLQNPSVQDQYLPDFVVTDTKNRPIGKVKKGDSFIFFNFRADRAIEFSTALTAKNFKPFYRKNYSPDDIFFAGMTEYNSDTHSPKHQLVPPVHFSDTLHEFLGKNRISELAVSESSKFGHITYYFNGNSYKCAYGEKHIKILSPETRHNLTPWMQSTAITDAVIENLSKYQFIRINYPNGDMVGHYADLHAGVIAMEAIDLQLSRLATEIDKLGGMMLITADHGNIEELLSKKDTSITSHTTNPVPCIFYDNTKNRQKYRLRRLKHPNLSNIAPTIALLLSQTDYPKSWSLPLITLS